MFRTTGSLLAMLLVLAACAAPQPTDPAVATNDQTEAGTPVFSQPAPPMAGPSPPRVLESVVKLDYSCSSDAQCVVKDIGNCCGTLPACVNRDSPADPAAVQAQCSASGMMSVCGFRPVAACQCSAGRCEPAPQAPPGGQP